MYKLCVSREFIAQHYLVGGDWGPENERHSHTYKLELELEGMNLNEHGFLVDIVEVEKVLEDTAARFRDKTLNDLPDFPSGLNPSIEHLCAVLSHHLAMRIPKGTLTGLTVRIWEDEIAWASFSRAISAD